MHNGFSHKRAPKSCDFLKSSQTLNGRSSFEQGVERRAILLKRVSDDFQHFVFRHWNTNWPNFWIKKSGFGQFGQVFEELRANGPRNQLPRGILLQIDLSWGLYGQKSWKWIEFTISYWHYDLLMNHYLPLLTTIYHYLPLIEPLFNTIYHYLNHYLPLFTSIWTTIFHSLLLFTTISTIMYQYLPLVSKDSKQQQPEWYSIRKHINMAKCLPGITRGKHPSCTKFNVGKRNLRS